jgi:hypothetical protein
LYSPTIPSVTATIVLPTSTVAPTITPSP